MSVAVPMRRYDSCMMGREEISILQRGLSITMKTRQFGNTDMQITPIGLGSLAIGGGGYEFGWRPQDDQESIATIKRALNLGINWIDTAAVYGLGHSEELVGKAIKGRDKPPLFTRCSLG